MVLIEGQPPALLHREPEFVALEHAFERAAGGDGSALVVEGQPGIGKTSLLDAGASVASNLGLRVLRARGSELEQDFGFGVARQLFGAAAGDVALDGAVALAAPALGRAPAEPELDNPLFAALHGLHSLLVELAEREPIALVIDDMHWADEPSQRLLAYLAARIESLPVALVAATWPVPAGTGSTAALMRDPATVVVRPGVLSSEEVATTLAPVLGADPEPALRDAVHRATGGNPFLVQALGRSLAADGDWSPERVSGLGPHEVADAVLARVGTAPPSARALAEAVAILGDDPERRHSSVLAGLDASAAAEAADALVDLHVLARGPALTFVHPILRASVLAAMGEGRRAVSHAAAARLRFDAGEPAEAVAAHLLHAPAAGDAWVVARLEEAAAAAAGHGAPDVGISALRRALAEPPSVDRRGAVLAALGGLEAIRGDAAADAHLTEAMSLAESADERAAMAITLGAFRHVAGDSDGAAAVLNSVARDLGDARRDLRVALAAGLHAVHRQTSAEDLNPAEGLAFDADELTGQTPGECALLVNLAMTEVLRAAPVERPLELVRRVLGSPVVAGVDGMASHTAVDAVSVLVLAERFEEGGRALDRITDAARSRGNAGVLLSALTVRSFLARREGRLASALADAREAHTLAGDAGLGFYARFAAAFVIDGLLDAGLVDEAEAVVASRDPDYSDDCQSNTLLLRRARLRAAQGRVDEAIADYSEAGRRLSIAGMENPSFNPWRTELAMLIDADDHERALRLAADELEHARATGLPRGIARAALTTAGLAPPGERAALLRGAIVRAEALPDPLMGIQGRLALGAALLAAGQDEPARSELRDAMDMATRCGARALAAQARAALIAAGGRPRREALSGPGSLTPAERRVARLAADGLTNREIAERLVVVPRTVEMHLTAAFRKLAVESRDELAAALVPASG